MTHECGKPLIGMALGDNRLFTGADARWEDSWEPSVPEATATLWRYMSFAKFCSLLERKELFFSLVGDMEDRYEGFIYPPIPREHGNPLQQAERFGHEVLRKLARTALISCWTESGHESSLSPNPPMGGVRTGEGGEGVTGAMIRARIRVDGRLAGGLEALLGAPMAAYSGCGERDGGIGHGKRRSRTGLARVCGDVGLAGGSVADGRRQAGSGMARSRARARLNCSSQGQRRGRCRVNRRAERVSRPAKAKTRRLRVLVVTIC